MFGTQLTTPKTEDSCDVFPSTMFLPASSMKSRDPLQEFMLAGPSGKPVDLDNLSARVVVPALNCCSICRKSESKHKKVDHPFERDASLPEWRGWYALRRGAGTAAYTMESPMAAKTLLRHENISATTQLYVKSVNAEAASAVDKLSKLFDNSAVSGRANRPKF